MDENKKKRSEKFNRRKLADRYGKFSTDEMNI